MKTSSQANHPTRYLPLHSDWSTVSHFLKGDDALAKATIGFSHNFGFPKPPDLFTCISAVGALTTRGKIPVVFGVIALSKTWFHEYRALEITHLESHPQHRHTVPPFLIQHAVKTCEAAGFQYLFRRSRASAEVLHTGTMLELSSNEVFELPAHHG